MLGGRMLIEMVNRAMVQRHGQTLQQRVLEGVQSPRGGIMGMVGGMLRRRKATGSAGNAGRTLLGGE